MGRCRHSVSATNSVGAPSSEGLEHWTVKLGYKPGTAVYARVNGTLYSVPFGGDYRDGEPKDIVFADTVSRLARRLVRGDGSRKQFKVIPGNVDVKKAEPATPGTVYDLERFISRESGIYVAEIEARRQEVERAQLTSERAKVVERPKYVPSPEPPQEKPRESILDRLRREYRERHGHEFKPISQE